MKRCRTTQTCPKIVHVDSEFEWWGSRASLNVTDPNGKPLALPPDVRLYMIAGAPHGAAFDAVAQPSKNCMMMLNPIHQGVILRAMLSALDAWVARGVAPPASRAPNLADGTLVEADAHQIAQPIPTVPYTGHAVPAWSEDLVPGPGRFAANTRSMSRR